MNCKYTLGIETSIGWGSISVFDKTNFVGGLILNRETAKSENLIWQIEVLLERIGVKKQCISGLLYSAGINLFAGNRSKLAILKAIGDAWQICPREVDIYRNIEKLYRPDKSSIYIIFTDTKLNLTGAFFADGDENFKVIDADSKFSNHRNSNAELSENCKIITPAYLEKAVRNLFGNQEILICEDNPSYYLGVI